VPIVIAVLAGQLILWGVFAVGDYIEDTSTVTVTLVSWGLSEHGQPVFGYLIECQSPGGAPSCPYRVSPGSDYTSILLISGFFANGTLTLETPSPFRLVSTTPVLPLVVPAGGVDLTVVLELPSTAGEYSFTGTANFQ
jgi:hypothetical protein